MSRLIIGARNAAEATLAAHAGADVVLLKEPGEGLPGALKRAAIRQAITAVGPRADVWAGIGDVAMQPEVVLRATKAIVKSSVARVMVPLHGPRAAECAAAVRELVENAPKNAPARLMAVVFADAPFGERPVGVKSFDEALFNVLAGAGFAGLMLDVAEKEKGTRLTGLMPPEELARFVEGAKAAGLECMLAGRLMAADVPALLALEPHAPDALAFRAAACVDDDPTAPLEGARVRELARLMGRDATETEAAETVAAPVPAEEEPAAEVLDKVFVRGLELDAWIGVHHVEKGDTQRVRIDVEAALLPRERAESIGQTICYDYIIEGIHDILARGHINLVETLAEEIAEHVLRHDLARAVTVRVEKTERVPGARLGVEISRRKRRADAAAVIPLSSPAASGCKS